jgi:hypothetical protein
MNSKGCPPAWVDAEPSAFNGPAEKFVKRNAGAALATDVEIPQPSSTATVAGTAILDSLMI